MQVKQKQFSRLPVWPSHPESGARAWEQHTRLEPSLALTPKTAGRHLSKGGALRCKGRVVCDTRLPFQRTRIWEWSQAPAAVKGRRAPPLPEPPGLQSRSGLSPPLLTLWSTLAAAQAGQAGQSASSLSAARTSLSHGKPAAFPSHSAQRFTPCRETDARGRRRAAAPCPLYPSRPASRAQSTLRLPPRCRAPPVTCGRTVSVGSAVAGGVGRRATSEPFSLSKLPLLSPSQGFEGAFPLFGLSADLRTGGSGFFFFLNFSL